MKRSRQPTPQPVPANTPIPADVAALAQRVSSIPPADVLRASVAIRDYVSAHPETLDVVRLMGGTADDLVWALLAQQLSAAVEAQPTEQPKAHIARRPTPLRRRKQEQ